MIKLTIEGDTRLATITQLLGGGMIDVIQIGDFTYAHAEHVDELQRRILHYEEPLPLRDADGNFATLTDHRFSDQGICVRCGEDAEAWDAGCVEKYVVDLESICTSEFVDALERVLRAARSVLVHGLASQLWTHITTVEAYMEKITEFYVAIEFAKNMGGGNAQEQDLAAGSTG